MSKHKTKTAVVFVTYRGHHVSVQELADVVGINRSTLIARINNGWDMDAACFAKPSDRVSVHTSKMFANQPHIQEKVVQYLPKVAQLNHQPPVVPAQMFGTAITKDIDQIKQIVSLVVEQVLEKLYK